LQGETVIVRRLLMPLSLFAMAAFAGQALAQGAFPAPLPSQSGGAASPFPPVNQSSGTAVSAPAAASPFPPVNNAAPSAPRPAAAASPFPSPSSTNAAASQGVFSQGARPLGGGLAAGGYAPQPQGPAGSAEQDECMAKFGPLRQDAERRAKLISAASERKASAQEACNLIKGYVAAEAKVVNYVTSKQTACNIPPEIPKQLKANQSRSQQMMKQVCQAATAQAGGGGGPAAPPSLSEVLGTSNVPSEVRSVRSSGGSTFDTINGNVLSR
jgi:hypothetical protein